MNDIIRSLESRRSVRKYQARQVEDALLDQALHTGLYAASGMNTQKTVMVAVRD